jgi:hemoglobin-like flavoprotein
MTRNVFLSPDEQILIKVSWGKLLTHQQEAGEIFYTHFFTLKPELKNLFRPDLKSQAHKLIAAITILVTKMNKASHIREEIQKLAHRHVQYGAKAGYFDVFKEALLITLEKILGENWNEAMKTAWLSAFELIAGAMIEEMEKVKK